MNDIKIVMLFKLSSSYSIMAEGVGCVVDSENGSFHSQITRRLPRKATHAAISAWKPVCARKSPSDSQALVMLIISCSLPYISFYKFSCAYQVEVRCNKTVNVVNTSFPIGYVRSEIIY